MFIVYKTATTGLWNWRHLFGDPSQPRLCGIAWALYDDRGIMQNEKYRVCLLPPEVYIPEIASNIHGITRTLMNIDGVPLPSVLNEFMEDWAMSTFEVGFNLSFDLHIVSNELYLLNRATLLQERKTKRFVDLMEDSKNICNIVNANGDLCFPRMSVAYEAITGRKWGRYPSLTSQVRMLAEMYLVFRKRYGKAEEM